MMDPYATLGVKRGASDGEIRRAFRKLAKELHPDLNPDDKAAVERFKKVSTAYEVIGDPDKRKAYDRGEIDGNGEPRRGFASRGAAGGFGQHAGAGFGHGGRPGPGGGGFSNFGFGDVFEEVFGGSRGGFDAGRSRRPPRGSDVRYTLEIDFLEAVNGAKKRVTLPEGGVLDLAVPEGVSDGQVLRLRGKGGECPGGGEKGDALVEIKVRSHPLFTRDGQDIHCDIPVTLDEAVLGGKIEVSTVGGRVQLSLPKGTSSGRVFRLKGKGVSSKPGGSSGDQLVTIRVVMPEEIDDELADFMSSWRETKGYNPGRR